MVMHELMRVTRGYKFLLYALAALLLLYPIVGQLQAARPFIDIFVFVVVAAGVRSAAFAGRRILSFSALLAVIVLLSATAADFYPQAWLIGLSTLSALLFFGIVVVVVLRDIFLRSDEVSAETIYGSISAYLLIGVTFAFLYMFMDLIQPQAFPTDDLLSGDLTHTMEGYLYFSFVTLTTLGFGDITPGTPQAGAFVYMESVFGQLYLTVLVARLVGIHISNQQA